MKANSNVARVEYLLAATRAKLEQSRALGYGLEKLADDVWVLDQDPDVNSSFSAPKDIDLSIGAIVHGNEVAGAQVMHDFVSDLMGGLRAANPLRLGLFFGNTKAARIGRRFVERDLNRSFGTNKSDLWEEKRAREIELLLGRSRYLIDLHQTIEPSARPFFIFPFSPDSMQLARVCWPELPIVTHWGDSFSADGRCSDEYVNVQGGAGLTLEMGQNGFHPYCVGAGTKVVQNAYSSVGLQKKQKAHSLTKPSTSDFGDVHVWAEVYPYVLEDNPRLNEGWLNFSWAEKGASLGAKSSGDIVTKTNGYVLFPQYLRDPKAKPPAELFRLVKPIAETELPEAVWGA